MPPNSWFTVVFASLATRLTDPPWLPKRRSEEGSCEELHGWTVAPRRAPAQDQASQEQQPSNGPVWHLRGALAARRAARIICTGVSANWSALTRGCHGATA